MPRQDKNTLFRREALARLDDIDELDRLVTVTHPRAWLTLGAVAALIVAAVVWASVGRLATSVSGNGILLAGGHVTRVVTTDSGQLDSLTVGLGDDVHEGETVGYVALPTTSPASQPERVAIVSPYAGRVVSLQAYPGQYLGAGAPVLTVVPTDEPVQAMLYLPVDIGKKVKVGQEVQIVPTTASVDEYGYMIGHVSFVATLPSTPESMQAVLQNEFLVQEFADGGPVLRVEADLVPAPQNPSGYAWSASNGPNGRISTGTTCTARIVLSRNPPITYAFPALKRFFGGSD